MTAVPAAELAWRIGGPQGSGIDTVANLFARACAIGGLEVFGRREYHSNIMGRHSYFDIRVADVPLYSHREMVDLVVCDEAESLARHALAVVEGGCIVHAAADADVAFDRMALLDPPLRAALEARLDEAGLAHSTAGLLALAQTRGITCVSLDLRSELKSLEEQFALAPTVAARVGNTLMLACSCALLQMPEAWLASAVEAVFGARPERSRLNLAAVSLAYRAAAEQAPLRGMPAGAGKPGQRLLLNAWQGVALGKLAAGMDFQSYYPISPATDESSWLEDRRQGLAEAGAAAPLMLQVEDELAAAASACGAALTGARAATATSGPGFSLMAETLGWAGMNELPLVVTLYQRGGPSTGMPTRTEQGDLQGAIYGGHGEFPRMVLASGDMPQCFEDAARAFDYAERYQLPVIHLLDKALTSTTVNVAPFSAAGLKPDRGRPYVPTGAATHAERFALTESGVSPRPWLGQPGGGFWTTGVEHGEDGRVSEDPANRERMMEKRARKLVLAAEEIPAAQKLALFGDPDAALTVLTWGSVAGPAREACDRLCREGVAARAIQLRLLWPFPAQEIDELLAAAAPLVVAENNFSGQLANLLSAETGRRCDHRVLKYSGRPISGEALYSALHAIHAGRGEPRMVLRNPLE